MLCTRATPKTNESQRLKMKQLVNIVQASENKRE